MAALTVRICPALLREPNGGVRGCRNPFQSNRAYGCWHHPHGVGDAGTLDEKAAFAVEHDHIDVVAEAAAIERQIVEALVRA